MVCRLLFVFAAVLAPVCLAATCSDGATNGDEFFTDCGGSCPDCPSNWYLFDETGILSDRTGMSYATFVDTTFTPNTSCTDEGDISSETSLAFNGVSSFVSLADGGFPYWGQQTTHTVSMWVNHPGDSTNFEVIYSENVLNNAAADRKAKYRVNIDPASPDKLSFYLCGDTCSTPFQRTSATTVFDGQWHQITWILSTNLNLYVDGVADASINGVSTGLITRTGIDTTTLGGEYHDVGAGGVLSFPFSGMIDNLVVDDSAQTLFWIQNKVTCCQASPCPGFATCADVAPDGFAGYTCTCGGSFTTDVDTGDCVLDGCTWRLDMYDSAEDGWEGSYLEIYVDNVTLTFMMNDNQQDTEFIQLPTGVRIEHRFFIAPDETFPEDISYMIRKQYDNTVLFVSSQPPAEVRMALGKSCLYPSCTDGVLNHHENTTDCGGDLCDFAGTPCPNCHDGIENGDELAIDCGGNCTDCSLCFDGILNGDEIQIDCNGSCPICICPFATDFQCSDGSCITAGQVCDGDFDCLPGNEDEAGCPVVSSSSGGSGCDPETQFQCDSGFCLDISVRCDGERQCANREDEEGCPYDDFFELRADTNGELTPTETRTVGAVIGTVAGIGCMVLWGCVYLPRSATYQKPSGVAYGASVLLGLGTVLLVTGLATDEWAVAKHDDERFVVSPWSMCETELTGECIYIREDCLAYNENGGTVGEDAGLGPGVYDHDLYSDINDAPSSRVVYEYPAAGCQQLMIIRALAIVACFTTFLACVLALFTPRKLWIKPTMVILALLTVGCGLVATGMWASHKNSGTGWFDERNGEKLSWMDGWSLGLFVVGWVIGFIALVCSFFIPRAAGAATSYKSDTLGAPLGSGDEEEMQTL